MGRPGREVAYWGGFRWCCSGGAGGGGGGYMVVAVVVVVVVGDGLAQVGMHAQVLVIVYVEIIPFSLAGMIHV